MRLTQILLSLLCFYQISPSADESNTKFWEMVSEYDSTIFNKDVSKHTLEKLEELAITSGGVLERKEIILKTIRYLEIHSSISDLNRYLRSNIDTIGASHADYLMLDAKLRIISSSHVLDSTNNANYTECGTDNCEHYSLALALFLEKKPEQYKKLEEHCNRICNFPLFHLAVMEFYKDVGDFISLEDYSKKIIDRSLEGELMTSEPLLPRYAMAYLSYVLGENGKKEASEFFQTTALEDILPNSFAYTLMQSASN